MSYDLAQLNPAEKEPDFEENESSEELSASNIQDRIIAYFELGNKDLMQENPPEVDQPTKEAFLKKVANGEIGNLEFQDLIKDAFMKDGSQNKELVAQIDDEILQLEQEAGGKYPEYALQKAKTETGDALTTLRAADGSSVVPENMMGWDNNSMRIAEETARKYNGPGKVEMIFPERARQLASQVEEDESAAFKVDKDLLRSLITPRYRYQIGPRIMNFSFGTDLGNGYTGVVGYVEKDDKVVAERFIKDNDSGSWRYADEKPTGPNGGRFVPIEIQEFLDGITADGQPKIRVEAGKEIFPEAYYRLT